MADAILSVSLEAQVSNFRQNLQTAAQEMNRTSQATERAVGAISSNIARVNSINLGGFQRALQAGQISLSRLNTTAAATATGLRPLTTGTNSAAFALTNLGRVAQDAPFGFIGIQNNLNPLLESFSRLRQETGSNGAALRALGQSLVGPAGLGIALSVVSAAVLFYQQYQQRANKVVKEAKTDADAYVNSLDQLTQAQLKGSKNAQKEITELNTLYGVTQNVALSSKQRADAVDTLQAKYPEYFKNLSDETILNGNAEAAYKRLATAIIETAKARAAQDIITKNSSRQLENEQRLSDLAIERLQIEQQLQAAKNNRYKGGGLGSGTAANTGDTDTANTVKLRKLNETLNTVIKLQNDLKTDSSILDSRNLKLTESITSSIQKGADLTDAATEKTGAKFKTLADILKELDNALKVNEAQYNATFAEKNTGKISAYQSAIDSLITNGYNPAADAVKRLREEQQKLFQLEAGSTTTLEQALAKQAAARPADPKLVGKAGKGVVMPKVSLDNEYSQILARQQKFNADLDNLVIDGLAGTIGNIGSAIGEALLAGGDIFSAAGGALLAGFGQFLDQFGKLLVEYGAAAILKTKLDAAILIPGAGIFAGAAAIAAGIALQIAAGAIGSLAAGKKQGGKQSQGSPTAFANGGVVYGPTTALIGEYSGARNNPEVVAPLNKLKSMLGDQNPIFQIIPIANSQQLSILVRNGDKLLNRVR